MVAVEGRGEGGSGAKQTCRPPRLTDDEKRPKAVPQKWKFGPKYKWFKNLIFGILFLKIFFRTYKVFIYLPRRSCGYQSFFNFRFSSRKSQSQQKVAKKITHTFYNTVLLKNTSLILRTSAHLTLKEIFSNTTFLTLQILQTCFCLVSEQIFVLHHFLTPKNCILEAHWKKMSVYFFISP